MSAVDLSHDDSGVGIPIVLLHAFPTDRTLWSGVAAQLSGDSWRVIAPDLRGFGGSRIGEDAPSLDVVADDIIALLDHLAIDRAVIGGLSLGGYVTLNLLRRYPQRIAGLVLVDTKAAADDDAAKGRRVAMAEAVERAGSNAEYQAGWLSTLIGPTSRRWRPAVVAQVSNWGATTSTETVAWYQRAMAARPDSFDALRLANIPALIIVGSEDEITPLADAEAMRQTASQAVLTVIGAVGHLSAIEDADPVAAAIREFQKSIAM